MENEAPTGDSDQLVQSAGQRAGLLRAVQRRFGHGPRPGRRPGSQSHARWRPAWGPGPDGAAAKIVAASSNYFASPACPDTGLLGALSFLWRGSFSTIGGAIQDLGSKGTGFNTTNSPLAAYVDSASPFTVRIVRAKASAYQGWSMPTQPVMTTGSHTIAGVCPPTLDLSPYLWIDGLSYYPLSPYFGPVPGPPTGGGYPWRIGRRADGNTQLRRHGVPLAVWQRQLAAAEVQSLTANPWQFRRTASVLFAPPSSPPRLRRDRPGPLHLHRGRHGEFPDAGRGRDRPGPARGRGDGVLRRHRRRRDRPGPLHLHRGRRGEFPDAGRGRDRPGPARGRGDGVLRRRPPPARSPWPPSP